MINTDCLLCDVAAADRVFDRVRVYDDGLWRLSVVRGGPVAGFAHLEPHRHIPHVSDLDGPEADTFGTVLARVTGALRVAAGAELTYAYVFGERVPHLHVNLAPHSAGDALVGGPGLLRPDAAAVPVEQHEAVARSVRDALRTTGGAP
jgi:diadenosine tetraphosphate (Ap4A) HIT family hydrolase